MRFAIYVALLFTVLPVVFLRPFFGLCIYYVVSFLQPKVLCWRPDFQDAMLVGVPLVVGAVAWGVRRSMTIPRIDAVSGRIRGGVETIVRSPLFEPMWPLAVCAALFIYIAISRLFADYPLAQTSDQFRALGKIVIITALLTGLASDFRRFRVLYIVIAMSVAFWAIKGGFKFLVLGPHQVYGKTYDNNFFALTSVMTLPMVFYFALSVRHARWRALLLVFAALMGLAIIGSHSRAGFVAFAVVIAAMAWSSRYRLRALIAALLLLTVTLAASAAEIRERVNSIVSYEKDRSARSRFHTWEIARELIVQNPLIGVGFNNFEAAKERYEGGRKAAHNIYLQNLAELGLIGHPLWLLLVIGSIISCMIIRARPDGSPKCVGPTTGRADSCSE
jgi:probable O-glycosylation ligase (exosortase A-associated)